MLRPGPAPGWSVRAMNTTRSTAEAIRRAGVAGAASRHRSSSRVSASTAELACKVRSPPGWPVFQAWRTSSAAPSKNTNLSMRPDFGRLARASVNAARAVRPLCAIPRANAYDCGGGPPAARKPSPIAAASSTRSLPTRGIAISDSLRPEFGPQAANKSRQHLSDLRGTIRVDPARPNLDRRGVSVVKLLRRGQVACAELIVQQVRGFAAQYGAEARQC